jgi:hypothetical protein
VCGSFYEMIREPYQTLALLFVASSELLQKEGRYFLVFIYSSIKTSQKLRHRRPEGVADPEVVLPVSGRRPF